MKPVTLVHLSQVGKRQPTWQTAQSPHASYCMTWIGSKEPFKGYKTRDKAKPKNNIHVNHYWFPPEHFPESVFLEQQL